MKINPLTLKVPTTLNFKKGLENELMTVISEALHEHGVTVDLYDVNIYEEQITVYYDQDPKRCFTIHFVTDNKDNYKGFEISAPSRVQSVEDTTSIFLLLAQAAFAKELLRGKVYGDGLNETFKTFYPAYKKAIADYSAAKDAVKQAKK